MTGELPQYSPIPVGPQAVQEPKPQPATGTLATMPQGPQGQPRPPIDPLGGFFDRVQQEQQQIDSVLGDWMDSYIEQQNAIDHSAVGQTLDNINAAGLAFADSIAHMGVLGVKALGAAESLVTGGTMAEGWADSERMLRASTGTTAPGAVDIVQSITKGAPPDGKTWGHIADETIAKRLGYQPTFAQTAGFLASFAAGPSALLGRGAAKVVAPMGRVAERAAMKMALKGVGADVQFLKNTGNFWGALSKDAQWQANATMMQRLMALGGRNADDLIGTTAANIAQSYATVGEGRGDAAWHALIMSPFMVPLARIGEKIGNAIATKGLTLDEAQSLRAVYSSIESGQIPLSQADDALRAALPSATRQRVGSLVGDAFEGTAFLGLDPSALDLFGKWLGGDSDAGAQLAALWGGSVTGLIVAKHGFNAETAPLFRRVRPDLNRLDTFIEAETVKRALDEAAKVKQDPSRKLPDDVAAFFERDTPLSDAEVAAQQQTLAQQTFTDMESWARYQKENKARDDAMRADQQGQKAQKDQAAQDAFFRLKKAVDDEYAWATPVSDPLIRGGWEPEIRDGTVFLRNGRSGLVRVASENGKPVVYVSKSTAEVLRNMGHEKDMKLANTSEYRIEGDPQEALNRLSLLALGRQIQANLTFGRRGLEPTVDGGWRDPQTGDHVYYDLDGSVGRKRLDGSLPRPYDDIPPLADAELGEVRYSSPALDALHEALLYKIGVSPDLLVDGVLSQAIEVARYGDDYTAQDLRQTFDRLTPEQVQGALTSQTDEQLAFLLGSLASGLNNAGNAMREFAKIPQRKLLEDSGTIYAEERKTAEKPMPKEGEPAAEPAKPLPEPARAPKEDPRAKAPIEEIIRPDAEAGSLKFVSREEAARAKKGVSELGQDLASPKFEHLRGKGDDAYADDVRMTVSDWRRAVGEVQPLLAKAEKSAKKAKRSLHEIVETPSGEQARWKALVEGTAEPTNSAERAFVADAREVLGKTFSQLREAGAVRRFTDQKGNPQVARLGKPDVPKVPRMMTAEGRRNLQDPAFRTEFVEHMIERNKLTKRDPETRRMRKMTVEEAEAHLFGDVNVADIDTPGRRAAAEFRRELKYFPDVYKGKELLSQDVFESMKRVVHQQSGRSATIKRHGPDITPEERKMLADRGDIETRPGVQARLEQFAKTVQRNDPEAVSVAKDIITSLEGGTAESSNRWLRGIQNIDTPVRALLTSAAFVQDIGDLFIGRNLIYGGFRRGIKVAMQVVRSPREGIILAERLGTVLRGTGARDATEATTWWMKLADAAASVGTLTEKIKTGSFTRIAESMLADWQNGRVTANDRWVVSEMLRFSPEQQRALLSGKADTGLNNAFRQEFVQMATARRLSHEGSKFAGNPNVRALVRFTNWATGNLLATARIYKSVAKDVFSGDPKRSALGAYRGIKATGLIGVTGLVGQMLAYAVMDAFRGENGFRRFMQEIAYAPGAMLAKAFTGQVLGGPYAQMLSAVGRVDDTQSFANLTTPGSWLYALSKAWGRLDFQTSPAAVKTAPDAALRLLGDVALPSWARNGISTMANAVVGGTDPRAISARRQTSAFMRIEGVESPDFPRNKPEEYYEAMRKVAKAVAANPHDHKAAWQQAQESIRTALGLVPEESVAATLRAYQIASRIPADKLDGYIEFMGDDQMRYIYAHDHALGELAKLAGLEEGTPLREFDKDLATAERRARLGDAKAWSPMVDRAVDDAAQRLAAGDGIGDDIRALAEAAAAFPEQQTWLSERQLRSLMRSKSYADVAKRIERLLSMRARERVQESRREQRRKK